MLSAEVFFLLHMKRSQAAQQPPEHSADPPEVNREVKVVMTENIRGNTFLLSTSSKILNVSVVNSDWHNCTADRGPNLTETIRTDALMNMNEHVEFNLSCWTVREEEGVRRKMVQFFKSVLIGMHPKERKSSGILCIHL